MCKPEFGDTTAIKKGQHPILNKLGQQDVVANDTFLSEATRLLVITGPNMSG